MTTTKLVDNKRRNHAAKVLIQASKKNQEEHGAQDSVEHQASETTESTASSFMPVSLQEQYNVIREDVLKLRDDLSTGYDLVKEWMGEKSFFRSLINTLSVSKRS